MFVIIKNIPQQLSKRQLEELLKTTVADTFWSGNGKVVDVEMIQAESRMGMIIEYHCVALIEPEAVAKRVIRILNGRSYFDVRFRVAEYVVRNWHNDRREDGRYKHMAREKRGGDRRRHLRIYSRRF
ncbi:MAG: hypothetical protein PHH11_11625 [Methylomonas sp.]|nr:hypothetical protein [Methylomonas sp.]